LLAASLCAASLRAAPVTASSDGLRTGWYPDQTSLTPQIVGGGSFGQLFSAPVVGQVYAQPLVSNGKLLVATEANWIYSFDAVTGAQNWSRNLGTPFNPAEVACGDLTPQIGITGTPVIDDTTGTAYLLAKSYVSGTSGPAQIQMHAIDMTSGNDRAGFPVTIQGAAQNQPGQVFNPRTEAQRPGLLLMNGVVYAGFGGHCDFNPYQGWVVGVSTAGQITAMWTDRAVSSGGGLWMSGSGLMSDRSGSMFFATGNSFNNGSPATTTPSNQPPADLGQSVVRLDVQADGTLQAADFFTPFDAPMLDLVDADLSSGGVVGLPSQFFGTSATPNLEVAAGKGGVLYLLNRDSLGGCRNGAGGMDAVVSRISPVGGTWSRPAIWPGDGGWLYLTINQGEFGYYQYGITGDGTPTFSHQGAPPVGPAFGLGSSPAVVTSNGTSSGSALVWIIWQADGSGANAELRAYDPVPTAGVAALRFSAPIGTGAKFTPPGIANGRVYVGTRDGHVIAFGAPTSTIVSGTSLAFPNTVVGQSSNLTEVLQASGPVTITAVSSSGAPFSVGAVSLPATLAAGQQLSIPVAFSPGASGSANGSLSIATSAGLLQENLSGLGLDNGPELTLTPGSIAFANTAVGGQATASFKLTNTGTAAVTISGTQLPAAPFSFTGLPADGATIASGLSISATAVFSPTTTGVFNGQLSINGQTVPLTGSATIPGVLTVMPVSLDFGEVDIGAAATVSFTVANTGGSPITITRSKPPVQGTFLRETDLDEGTILAAGEVRSETIRFAPTVAGTFSDSWSLNSDVGTEVIDVAITGTGVTTGLTAVPDPAAGGWQLNGTSTLLGNFFGALLQLTGATQQFAAGTAFWPATIPSANLTASFDATIGGGNGADGLTLVLANPSTAPTKVGVFGGQLGFGGITGTAVVLDTFQNGPTNVVGISDGIGTDGNVHYLAQAPAAATPNLRSGSHHVSVSYSGGVLSVSIDGAAAVSATVALPSNVLIGFTGGTGGDTDQHAVSGVSITSGTVTVPATVVLAEPADGGFVSGLFPIVAQASTLAVAPLQSFSLAIDGAQVASGTSNSISFAWDTTVLATGSAHVVTATAVDTEGNTSSATAHVTVKNPVVVQVTAPAAGAIVAGNSAATAIAVPPLGLTITNLQVMLDRSIILSGIGTTLTGPWNSTAFPNGTHSLTAVAADSSNGSTTSAPVQIIVRNPPAALLSSPLNAAVVAGVVPILASGQAPSGASLSSLVLRIDSAPVASSNGTPISFNWQTAALDNGSTHVLEIDASDGDGTSSNASVTVTVANPPAVALAAVASSTVAGMVSLGATATPAPGASISQLSLFIDGKSVAASSTSPVAFSWDTTALPNGSVHFVVARVVQSDGLSADTQPLSLTVVNQPIITLSAPTEDVAGVVALSATGIPAPGTSVASTTISIDGQQVATSTTGTVSFNWDTTTLANGTSHAISAQIVDADGTSASATATLAVANPVAPVTVVISSPAAGDVSGSVQISATATVDRNATLTQLAISAGGLALGSSAQSPLTVSWNSTQVADGAANIVATATDSAGNTASATVTVQVKNGTTAPAKSGGCGSTGENAAPIFVLLIVCFGLRSGWPELLDRRPCAIAGKVRFSRPWHGG
jgi:Bacterial Ig domain